VPPHAREIFLAAFNSAWQSYADRGPGRREEAAFRIAWAAVKKPYRKSGGLWVKA
jgi:cation transport regulator